MTTINYEKTTIITIVLSLFSFASFDNNSSLSSLFGNVSILLLIVWFIKIWANAQHWGHLLISMILPAWIILLVNPQIVNRQVFFYKREQSLKELYYYINLEKSYQLITQYHYNEGPLGVNFPTSSNSYYNEMPHLVQDYRVHSSENRNLHHIGSLMKKASVKSFELGHGYIIFNFHNAKPIRYHTNKKHKVFLRDKKIKEQWYWVL